jgi:YfiH family protein
MIRNEINGIVFYTFNSFANAERIRHLFSTRKGGVSQGNFAEMNLSVNKSDSLENVKENYRRISSLGFPVEKMVFSDQVHGVKIKKVFQNDCGKGYTSGSDIVGIDGLMTNVPNIVLVTFYADCVPLYFYDPVKNAIALSHAGWRGTVMEIGKIAVNEMIKEYGSCPGDIIVGIGPSICEKCFEVGGEVAAEFNDKFSYSAQFVIKSQTISGKYYIDLQRINKQILMDAGIMEHKIELPNICTKCNTDIFYSHRAMGSKRGNMAAFLSIV